MSVRLQGKTGLAATLGAAMLALANPAKASDDATLPMDFSIAATSADCKGCIVINASGQIVDETARDFATFLSRNRLDGALPPEENATDTPQGSQSQAAPQIILAFESVGGKVQAALIMGRRIRKSGWITVVGQAHVAKGRTVFSEAGCYSACTMVVLGGTSRFVVPGSKVGIHQFSPQFGDNETFSAREMNQIVREYGREIVNVYDFAKAMNVKEDFFVSTLRTPFDSLDVLPEEQWLETGIATALLPAGDGETSAQTILAAAHRAASDETASIVTPPKAEDAPKNAEPSSPSAPQTRPTGVSSGMWTVSHASGAPASAQFLSKELRLSLVCSDRKSARINLSFLDLPPLDLERLRAAAFSARLLNIAGIKVTIDNVALPANGEQSLGAVVDIAEVKALPASNALTFAVLDKQGVPVGQALTVSTDGAEKAIIAAMADCGI